jgi:alpha-amylase
MDSLLLRPIRIMNCKWRCFSEWILFVFERSSDCLCLGVRFLRALCFTLLIAAASAAQAGSIVVLQHQPNDQTRPWHWRMIIDHLPMIKQAGYTAILISPHQKACGGQWSLGYDPYDFTSFDSAHGSEQQLAELIQKAHALRIHVYADMVMNHMCGNLSNGVGYPRFSERDFHRNGRIPNDSRDQWELENRSLGDQDDLAHESPYVQDQLWNFLVKTNNMGFDGYRWDAAKHVPRWYWSKHILPNVRSWGKYSFGEVLDGNIDYLFLYVGTGMAVTDYNLYFVMRDNFRFGGNLAALDGTGIAARDGANALTFVQNHDTGPPQNRLLAQAFIAAYPGYPAFFDVNLRDRTLNNLVWIQNTLAVGPYVNRYKDADTIVFSCGNSLLTGINQRGEWVSRWVQTPWNNTHIHDYSGHAQDTRTNDAGWVELSIPPQSYVMMAPLR